MSPRRRSLHGLYARNFPRDRRWAIDQDYADKLTPDEKAWLAEFNDRYYGGDFRDSDPDVWDPPARSVVNRDKHASAADALTLAGLEGGAGVVPLAPDGDPDSTPRDGSATGDNGNPSQSVRDWTRTPEYQDDPDYKAARAEYRQQLRQGRRDREPVASPTLERARRKLNRLIPPASSAPNGQTGHQSSNRSPPDRSASPASRDPDPDANPTRRDPDRSVN